MIHWAWLFGAFIAGEIVGLLIAYRIVSDLLKEKEKHKYIK